MGLIIIFVVLIIFLLLILAIKRARNHNESKISIEEHPATFKKPLIEMLSRTGSNKYGK